MRARLLIPILALCAAPVLVASAQPKAPPVEVMIVGVFHMSNPGQDLHNMQVEDVLAPRPQAQIAAVTKALARFHPDKVAVEWPEEAVAGRWPKYLAGTLPPSRNEVVQFGFRLAKTARANSVWGIDVDGDFPYDPVKAWADAHRLAPLLDAQGAALDAFTAREQRLLAERGVAAALRNINDPARLAGDNAFYRTALRIGADKEQPGADLLTAWYRRNFLICAKLLQLSRPGDRIVVFFGYGHAFLLRQCVQESPGLELIEPNAYLPR